jgi:hypothetical protein
VLTAVGFKLQMLRVADLSDSLELLLRPSKSGQFLGCLKPKGSIENIAYAQYQSFINTKQLVCHAAVLFSSISDHGLCICSQPLCMFCMRDLSGWCHAAQVSHRPSLINVSMATMHHKPALHASKPADTFARFAVKRCMIHAC